MLSYEMKEQEVTKKIVYQHFVNDMLLDCVPDMDFNSFAGNLNSAQSFAGNFLACRQLIFIFLSCRLMMYLAK